MTTVALQTARQFVDTFSLEEQEGDHSDTATVWSSLAPPISLTWDCLENEEVLRLQTLSLAAPFSFKVVFPRDGSLPYMSSKGVPSEEMTARLLMAAVFGAKTTVDALDALQTANDRVVEQEAALNRYKAAMDTVQASKGVIRDS